MLLLLMFHTVICVLCLSSACLNHTGRTHTPFLDYVSFVCPVEYLEL